MCDRNEMYVCHEICMQYVTRYDDQNSRVTYLMRYVKFSKVRVSFVLNLTLPIKLTKWIDYVADVAEFLADGTQN